MTARNYDDHYKKLRSDVLKRDKNKCQMPGCKSRSRRLEVHHILPWSKYPQYRFTVANCITLCKAHHKKVTGKENLYAAVLRSIIIKNSK